MCLDINFAKVQQYSVSQREKASFIRNREKKFSEFCWSIEILIWYWKRNCKMVMLIFLFAEGILLPMIQNIQVSFYSVFLDIYFTGSYCTTVNLKRRNTYSYPCFISFLKPFRELIIVDSLPGKGEGGGGGWGLGNDYFTSRIQGNVSFLQLLLALDCQMLIKTFI